MNAMKKRYLYILLVLAIVVLAGAYRLLCMDRQNPFGRRAAADSSAAVTTADMAGGHLVARHVGLSEGELARRLATEPGITAASSFTDGPTADAAVATTLQARQAKITAWRKAGGDRLVLTYRLPKPVGTSMKRGAAHAVPAAGVRLVLVRDSSAAEGYHILTGYPTP